MQLVIFLILSKLNIQDIREATTLYAAHTGTQIFNLTIHVGHYCSLSIYANKVSLMPRPFFIRTVSGVLVFNANFEYEAKCI